jgi:phosphopantothenoylcysteine decarboxylase/phosphopantothenate--cysteine ligase
MVEDRVEMTRFLDDKTIVLGVTGGIAAYKSVELLRLLRTAGARVPVVMTRSATRFVGPTTFAALSGEPVWLEMFATPPDAAMRHIDWAQQSDAVVVAPATANILGKLAGGIADDPLSTLLLAATCPVMLCPAMNTHMFGHPAVARNLARLAADGHCILPPDSGDLACGTVGAGRLPDPAVIFDRVLALLTPKDLRGRRILVTAGPTREPLDPVRFLSNPSSGRMGFAVARAAEHRGGEVTLVSGPSGLADPFNVATVRVTTAREMAEAVWQRSGEADIVIKTAAVSDYRPAAPAPRKIKKQAADTPLVLTRNPDILLEVGRRKQEHQVLVGFAAETDHLDRYAAAKLKEKNLDLIVANRIGAPGAGFEVETNIVSLFYRDGRREDPGAMSKDDLAHLLLDRIVDLAPGK